MQKSAINHNGDMDITEAYDISVEAGCNAVKFQKRTSKCLFSQELARPRESPFALQMPISSMPGIWSGRVRRDRSVLQENRLPASLVLGRTSADFIDQFNPPCYKNRLAILN